MESLVAGAEAWLNETGKLAATWLGDDPEETEAHVHMRHARQVALALERGAEPPPAPTVAPRYEPRGDWDASGAEQSGVSDAEGGTGAAKSTRRWRERPPPGSPAARAECAPERDAQRARSAAPACGGTRQRCATRIGAAIAARMRQCSDAWRSRCVARCIARRV
jgi:hypothetical protein